MALTFGITAPVSTFDDLAPTRTRRSRLSIHITTPRARRWLLVQLVTLPVGEDPDGPDGGDASHLYRHHEPAPESIERLLDAHSLERGLHRWV